MLKRFLSFLSPKAPRSPDAGPQIIPRDQHSISRKNISSAALKIIRQLEDAGYAAYLVGGGVRDLLLDNSPKDFDVATNAKPEEVRRLFRGARVIGRRFQIVHVRMGREMIEVTTFRGHHEDEAHAAAKSDDGMLLRDNVYGTLETDAARRDFSVNALYYSPKDFTLLDFCDGLSDIRSRTLRIIGDPATRYKEDPVRMLRAVRFAGKLGFSIEPETAAPIRKLGTLLNKVSDARLFEEMLKLFLSGSATAIFHLLREYDLLRHLSPGAEAAIETGDPLALALIEKSMINTDKRLRAGKTVNPAFIYAALMWPALAIERKRLSDLPPHVAYNEAAQKVISQQLSRTALPKRFIIPMREIWDLQDRLPQRQGQRALRTLEHPRFRAAYDFLLMREESGEDLNGLGNWWTQFQSADEATQEQMIKNVVPAKSNAGRGRRPKTAKPKSTTASDKSSPINDE